MATSLSETIIGNNAAARSYTTAWSDASGEYPYHLEDLRQCSRRRVWFPGIALINDGASSFNCTVFDLSEKGAGISWQYFFPVGDISGLQISTGTGCFTMPIDSRLAWSSASRGGLEFIERDATKSFWQKVLGRQ